MTDTLFYLATPYSKYPGGLEAAFDLACSNAALLVKAGVPVFSPIVHTHPIAMNAGMDPLDHTIWLPCDEPMMNAATGIIMLTAESWEKSYGMKVELEKFIKADKEVVWMKPGVVPDELKPVTGKPLQDTVDWRNDPLEYTALVRRDPEPDPVMDSYKALLFATKNDYEAVHDFNRFVDMGFGDKLAAKKAAEGWALRQ